MITKRNIIACGFSAIITMAILFGAYPIFAEDSGISGSSCPDDLTFRDLSLDVAEGSFTVRDYPYECVQELYQKSIDGLFQAKMKGIIVMFKDSNDVSTVMTADAKRGDKSIFANPFLPTGGDSYKSPGDLARAEVGTSFDDDITLKMNTIKSVKKELILQRCQPDGNQSYTDLAIKKYGDVEKKAGNLSSYCVGMEATYLYEDYYAILSQKISDPLINDLIAQINNERVDDNGEPLTEEEKKSEEFASRQTTTEVKKAAAKFAQKANEELGQSKEVLKATVAAYDEFRNAYPSHKVYEQIITDLVKYKNMLRDVRRNMILLPAKFINLTSATCP